MLAFTGGSLDAFLYFTHGGVFAGAMTGNVVVLGVALYGRQGAEIFHHLLPILGFFAGVWSAELLQGWLPRRAVLTCLFAEVAGLLAASFLPRSFPESVFVFCIAFLAALQIGTFATLDKMTYSSTYVTGDMRTLAVGVYQMLGSTHRAQGLRQTRDLGSILLCFLAGAVAGAALSRRHGNHVLWLPAALLFIVAGLITWRAYGASDAG